MLWPQPKYINLDDRFIKIICSWICFAKAFRVEIDLLCKKLFFRKRIYSYPKDGRLKIYFDRASEAEPRVLMQIIQMSAQILASIQLELHYRGYGVSHF